MLTVVAFIVALGLLIAVHEYGHYRVAVACGVKVLRFSLGFGKVLYRWQPKVQKNGQTTEFVLSAFPLGGYVKMLDEREGPVDAVERHLAFNNQPLRARAAIVAAGPLANLALAVLLYATVNWIGVQEPRAILASPVAQSIAEAAGLKGGEEVLASAFDGEEFEPVRSFESLRWQLTQGALDGRNLRLQVADQSTALLEHAAEGAGRRHQREVRLELDRVQAKDADAMLMRKIGLLSPYTEPVIGEVMAGGAAERAGLLAGDLVLAIGSQTVVDGQQLRELIRASIDGQKGVTKTWRIQRGGSGQRAHNAQTLELPVTPELKTVADQQVGRVDAYVGAMPAMLTVQYGPVDGLWRAAVRTWEVSALTLRMMGKMVIGEASLKNLSGPLTIADYAGKSASMGLNSYLIFLALISVSLGVLNLLPLPVLDGGHLMYYLWEALTGKGVSERWLDGLQRTGVAVLLLMMSIAMFNDLTRFFG
jgi:regulator of sigma E protease